MKIILISQEDKIRTSLEIEQNGVEVVFTITRFQNGKFDSCLTYNSVDSESLKSILEAMREAEIGDDD